MTTNSQLSTSEPKKQKQKQTKQTTRTGTESQKWSSHGGLSVGRERGKREQEIRSLFEKIMKENLPNLVKEIDIQVQEAQSPQPREAHTKTHHN